MNVAGVRMMVIVTKTRRKYHISPVKDAKRSGLERSVAALSKALFKKELRMD